MGVTFTCGLLVVFMCVLILFGKEAIHVIPKVWTERGKWKGGKILVAEKKKWEKAKIKIGPVRRKKHSQSSRQGACVIVKHPLQSSHQMPSSWPFLVFTHLYTEHYTTREILMFTLRFLLQGAKTQQDLVFAVAPLPGPAPGTEKISTKYAPDEKMPKKDCSLIPKHYFGSRFTHVS